MTIEIKVEKIGDFWKIIVPHPIDRRFPKNKSRLPQTKQRNQGAHVVQVSIIEYCFDQQFIADIRQVFRAHRPKKRATLLYIGCFRCHFG
jgi:hypothetical protein